MSTCRLLSVWIAMLASLGCASSRQPPVQTEPRAQPLFEAMPYDTWRVIGAPARFSLDAAEGGATVLTGRGPIPSNGFLASPRSLGDFRLEVDVRLGSADNPLGDKMNSGIQIRSAEKGGAVGGLQVEVDPSKRSWSGGIYDERGRLWLAPLDGTDAAGEAARAAFRRGGWNRYEIECIGPRIRTRVNGVACAEWYDAVVSGLLAFQVHGGPSCEVAFRDARIEELGSHAWRTLASGAGASSGERCAWSARLAPEARGVRVDVVGAGRMALTATDGAAIVDVSFTAADGGAARRIEAVWIDGAGAVLIDGRRAARFAASALPAEARVLGESCTAARPEWLSRD